jgi:hypothetical protein
MLQLLAVGEQQPADMQGVEFCTQWEAAVVDAC